jgi:hypothetical protein
VRLGGEMHYMGDAMLAEDLANGLFITQINFLKNIFRVCLNVPNVREMTGVGQAIQVYQPLNDRLTNNVMNNVTANKSGSARQKKVHNRNSK